MKFYLTMNAQEATLDRLYALVANEEDARICTEISDDACRVVPGNFFLMLSSSLEEHMPLVALRRRRLPRGGSAESGRCLSHADVGQILQAARFDNQGALAMVVRAARYFKRRKSFTLNDYGAFRRDLAFIP